MLLEALGEKSLAQLGVAKFSDYLQQLPNVTAGGGGPGRDVRVSINLAAPRGSDAPVMLRRSSRQVASAVARAMREA